MVKYVQPYNSFCYFSDIQKKKQELFCVIKLHYQSVESYVCMLRMYVFNLHYILCTILSYCVESNITMLMSMITINNNGNAVMQTIVKKLTIMLLTKVSMIMAILKWWQ